MVLVLIALSTAAILFIAFYTTPSIPVPPLPDLSPASIEAYQRAVEQYKQLGDVPLTRATTLFKDVVITAFLPSFTAILGYIFGTRVATRNENAAATDNGAENTAE